MSFDDDANPFQYSKLSSSPFSVTATTAVPLFPQQQQQQLSSSSINRSSQEFSTPLRGRLSAAAVKENEEKERNDDNDGDGISPAPRIINSLGPQGIILASLHSTILQSTSNISLADEISLLLNLLAVPLTATVASDVVTEMGIILTCGAQAQQYAALVMQQAGGLLKGLGPQLLEDVAGAAGAAVIAAEPLVHPIEDEDTTSSSSRSFLEAMVLFKDTATAAENVLRSRQLRTEKAFNQKIKGVFGVHEFTSDGIKSRSMEEQRKLSNREACRDSWFAIMRDTAIRTTSFGATTTTKTTTTTTRNSGGGAREYSNNSKNGTASVSIASGADDGGGNCSAAADEPDGAVFNRLQISAAHLLRALRPDNFTFIAELITTAILQAAATGEAEALMDAELTRLAKRDGVSRFHSLNRRMMMGVESQGLSSSSSSNTNASNTAIGFGGGGQGSAPPSPFKLNKTTGGGGGGGRTTTANKRSNFGSYNSSTTNTNTHHGMSLPSGAQAAVDAAAATAAALMSDFPRPLRLYILFLEAADSHRLNTALIKTMTEKLKALTLSQSPRKNSGGSTVVAAAASASGHNLGEKVVAATALAGFLGYLSFAKNSGGGSCRVSPWDEESDDEENEEKEKETAKVKYDGSHPVDVFGAVRAALGSSTLLRTLPWVTRYLHFFLEWTSPDETAESSPYFQSLLGVLGELRSSVALTPSSGTFGPAALCLRSLLDDFAARRPLPQQRFSSSKVVDKVVDGDGDGDTFAMQLSTADPIIDVRYTEQCCPVLAHARRLFSAERSSTSSSSGLSRASARRILPTAPLAKAAAAAPPPSTTAATGFSSSTSSSLLMTTLASTSKGPLFSLPPAVAAARAAALTTDPVKLRLQQTFLKQYSDDSSLVKLKDVVEYSSDVIGCNAASSAVRKVAPAALKTAAEQLVTTVTEHAQTLDLKSAQSELEKFANAAAEKAAAATIEVVIQAAFETAKELIKVAAVRAMLGLIAPELGEAVIATAAGIVAETAAGACAGRLAGLAQKAVRQDALAQHAKAAVRDAVKGAGSSSSSSSTVKNKLQMMSNGDGGGAASTMTATMAVLVKTSL